MFRLMVNGGNGDRRERGKSMQRMKEQRLVGDGKVHYADRCRALA